ncbi:MAG: radical SAM protein [Bacteroidota bacterium]
MQKVLFTHSYFLRFDPKMWQEHKPYPPLGTIYAAALLRENGYSVSLFDVMFAEGPQEILPQLAAEQPDALVIYDDGFNYLTKMCLTNMREAALTMCGYARSRGMKVLVCSSDSTDHCEKYLDAGADAVILGEGEMGLLETLGALERGETDLDTIRGLAYRKAGTTQLTERRPVIRDLDRLPPPAWDLIDIAPYQEAWSRHGYFSINMATTRGCPYKCNWCAKPIYGNRYNSHSPAGKAEELAFLVREFKADHVWFCDDIFGLKPGWVQKFADEIAERNLKVRFKIQSRADLLLKDDTVEALARAGCEEVWLGAESGSQKILDAMDKGITVAQIHASRKMLGKHGIRTAFFLQFGYLGETQADIQATFAMLAEAMPDDIGVSVSYPLPGTKFYEKVAHELGDKTNWTDSDELALMFRNHHSPEYYKRLHRYVHKHYRKLQGFASLGSLPKGKIDRENLRRAASVLYYIPAAWLESRRLNRLKNG